MENVEYQTVEGFNQEEKRPGGLTLLCILTFLGSGLSFLSNFASFAFHEALSGVMDAAIANMTGTVAEIYQASIEVFTNTPQYVFLILAILYVGSICGAAIMFAMRKIGFHIYAIAQILIVAMPLVTNGKFDFVAIFLAMAFIALYFMYYKKLK